MAIKASGFQLNEVKPDSGYAVMQGDALKAFYLEGQPENYQDVEQAGSQRARDLTLTIPGLAALRPSVEAGFHSLLDTFVIHSHSVWANLAACAKEGEKQVRLALQDAPYAFAVVPYVNPGAGLTFTMRDRLEEATRRQGKRPAVLVMMNHGLITHAEDMAQALALHEDANARFQEHFGLKSADWPSPRVTPEGEGFVSDTPWLGQRLRGESHPDSQLLEQPLYPDQLVFFQGTLGKDALINRQSGLVFYRLPEKSARTVEETLCAVVFIREVMRAQGLIPQSMGEAARAFISGWESEKYRKALSQGKT